MSSDAQSLILKQIICRWLNTLKLWHDLDQSNLLENLKSGLLLAKLL